MYVTVNGHVSQPGGLAAGILAFFPDCAVQVARHHHASGGSFSNGRHRPKRRSLASPDRLALLTQTHNVTANVRKGRPLTNGHLKGRSLSSRRVKRPGGRELQMAARQWRGVGWGQRRKGPTPCAVCLPGTTELRPATGSCPRPSHPRAVVTDPRSIIHQLQPEKEGMHRKPSSLHTAQSPALLKD